MIGKLVINGLERMWKKLWLHLRYYPGTGLKRMREFQKLQSQYSVSTIKFESRISYNEPEMLTI
jgi:hypothetical protein